MSRPNGHTARASFFDAVSARGEFMTDAERHVMEDAEWRARAACNRPVIGFLIAQSCVQLGKPSPMHIDSRTRPPKMLGAIRQEPAPALVNNNLLVKPPATSSITDTISATDTNFAFFASVASASVCAPGARVSEVGPGISPDGPSAANDPHLRPWVAARFAYAVIRNPASSSVLNCLVPSLGRANETALQSRRRTN